MLSTVTIYILDNETSTFVKVCG